MAIKSKLEEDFLLAIEEIEVMLVSLLFKRHSFFEKGFAYYIDYRKVNNVRVEFLFGPSGWDVEMIIYTPKGEFAFRDLMKIPEINTWVNNNRYIQENGRNVKNELLWFVELLRISLPIVE